MKLIIAALGSLVILGLAAIALEAQAITEALASMLGV
jgi:hypothetical protein